MQQKIMATLPAKEFRLSCEDLFSRMSAIKESKFFSTCPLVGQQDLLSVMDLVGNMMNSISPDKDMVKSNDIFFTQVFIQLGLFLQVEIEGKNEYGSAAAQHLFLELNTKYSDGTVSPTLTDLDTIQKFQWLLDDKETRKLSGWVVNAISAAKTLKRRRPTQSPGPSSGKQKAKAGSPAASTSASFADSTSHIAQYFS